jgi:hypothetical protein
MPRPRSGIRCITQWSHTSFPRANGWREFDVVSPPLAAWSRRTRCAGRCTGSAPRAVSAAAFNGHCVSVPIETPSSMLTADIAFFSSSLRASRRNSAGYRCPVPRSPLRLPTYFCCGHVQHSLELTVSVHNIGSIPKNSKPHPNKGAVCSALDLQLLTISPQRRHVRLALRDRRLTLRSFERGRCKAPIGIHARVDVIA